MKIETPEGFSLFGEPLYNPVSYPDPENKQLIKFNKAYEEWGKDPEDRLKLLWLGRQHAYMGKYRDAIHIYAEALKKYPDDPEFLRHRAHRYLSLRMFDFSIRDSERTVDLMLEKPDFMEPSGLAGAEDTTEYTFYTNTYYHLGLAYLLKGDLLNARKSFYDLLDVAVNDDHIVMSCYWNYIILRRLGYDDEAKKVLRLIKTDMKCPVSRGYFECLKMYRGELEPEDIIGDKDEEDQLSLVTTGFGVANEYMFRGEYDKYVELLERVVSTSAWSGFGYISAEVDLKRIRG
ncbi:tetratricopeptide repeat protein [Candidatus Bathyarchaeota archaeon]|nr:tetratricopeptide repeat protein [Candidatus Bathyarchaeota archaeon]